MVNWIDLGSHPSCEDDLALDDPTYETTALRYAEVFVALIRRRFGREPPETALSIVTLHFRPGPVVSVICSYDTPEGEDYAFHVRRELPQYWDRVAQKLLAHQKGAPS